MSARQGWSAGSSAAAAADQSISLVHSEDEEGNEFAADDGGDGAYEPPGAKRRKRKSERPPEPEPKQSVRVTPAVLLLQVYDLKSELKSRGQKVTGSKVELQVRLQLARDSGGAVLGMDI